MKKNICKNTDKIIAKIGKGEDLYGAISYNQKKIDSENGQVLLLNRIPETLYNNLRLI